MMRRRPPFLLLAQCLGNERMMILMVLVAAVAIALLGVFLWLIKPRGFRRRSPDDIVDLLLNVNESIQDVEAWLSPGAQQQLHALSINDTAESKVCYRRDVHAVLERLFEFFSRMKRDVLIMNDVANTERQYLIEKGLAYSDEARRALDDVIRSSDEFLKAIRMPLLFLKLWKRVPLDEWRFVPVPRLASFGHSRGADVLAAYRRVKESSVAMSSLLYPGVGAIRETIQQRM
jgi:hypothetical protein